MTEKDGMRIGSTRKPRLSIISPRSRRNQSKLLFRFISLDTNINWEKNENIRKQYVRSDTPVSLLDSKGKFIILNIFVSRFTFTKD